MNRRPGFRDDAGFSLVEVMVSAVVTVLVATATVSSIGASQKQSTRTLARGITANLAEQDQERMKAMRTRDLVNYTATRVVAQQGINYTVASKTEFVQGPNGTSVSCTSSGEQTSYLRLTSTVTPQASLKADPLTVQSFYPLPIADFSPTSGTLLAQVFAANGTTGQQGVAVSVTGPESRALDTNDRGCAVFQFLRAGAYTLAVNEPGYVDQSLRQAATWSGTVTASTINQTTPLLYDRAGSISATFDGSTTGASRGISVSNSALGGTNPRTFTGRTAAGLFPFTGPYLVYGGTCAANDPTRWDSDFYTTPGTFGKATVPPGGSVGVNVHEPVLNTNITVKRANTSVVVTTPRVYVVQVDSGCDGTPYITTFESNGTLTQPDYPYGNYVICAEVNKTSGTGTNGVYSVLDYDAPNTRTEGSLVQAMQIDTTNTDTNTSRRTCLSRG